MPEGVEVHLIANEIKKTLLGGVITRVWLTDWNRPIPVEAGWTLTDVCSWGKRIYMTWETKDKETRYTATHLMLSGRLYSHSVAEHLPWLEPLEKYRLIMAVRGRSSDLVYYEEGGIGEFVAIDSIPCMTETHRCLFDDDPDDLEHTRESLQAHPRMMIGSWLLSQHRFVGVGAYMTSEILHEAKIHPRSTCEEIDDEKLHRLVTSVSSVTDTSRACGGYSYSKLPLMFLARQDEFSYVPVVHGRTVTKQGESVKVSKVAGRSIYTVL